MQQELERLYYALRDEMCTLSKVTHPSNKANQQRFCTISIMKVHCCEEFSSSKPKAKINKLEIGKPQSSCFVYYSCHRFVPKSLDGSRPPQPLSTTYAHLPTFSQKLIGSLQQLWQLTSLTNITCYCLASLCIIALLLSKPIKHPTNTSAFSMVSLRFKVMLKRGFKTQTL